MIAVADYGAGNLFSVKNACDFLSIETRITRDPALIRAAEGIILPGVGAFPDAMQRLKETGLIPVLQAEAQKKPLLGICLGMQMLFDYSTEFGRTEGLGLIPGHVDRIPCQDLKLPHIGWNELKICQPSPILEGAKDGDFVYFVHSFAAFCGERYLLASTDYGCTVPALVGSGTVFGAQFHPEKSGGVGLRMLQNFAKVVAGE